MDPIIRFSYTVHIFYNYVYVASYKEFCHLLCLVGNISLVCIYFVSWGSSQSIYIYYVLWGSSQKYVFIMSCRDHLGSMYAICKLSELDTEF